MPRKSIHKRSARKRPSKSRDTLMLRALTDLKIATARGPTPRVIDIPKMIFLRAGKVHTFSQTYAGGYVNLSATAFTSGALNFTLGQLSGASNYASIFDQWRIAQVTVKFVPQVSLATGGSGNPPLLTVLDYDDANAPTSANTMLQYDTVMETPMGNYVERTIAPKYAVAAYSGSFTSYSASNRWIDVASQSVQWYGVKWYSDISSTVYAYAYVIEVEVIFQFKYVR